MRSLSFAWRESRGSRARLLLFSSSIVLGVAALVAVSSFVASLRDAMDLSARSLLGADILVRANRPFGPDDEAFLARIPGEQAREVSFTTMAASAGGRSRLSQVRAISGAFPFYGEIKTDPPEAAKLYQHPGEALVDRSLLLQLGLRLGDSLRIGNAEFHIAGSIERIPGDSPLWETVAPRIFIGLDAVASTGLIRFGSLANYRAYYRSAAPDPGRGLEADAKRLRLRIETVEERKRSIERISDNIHWYLRLSSFFALVLGTLGMASGVRLYLTSKLETVAILRCLGAARGLPMRIFLLQTLLAALAASAAGAILGGGLQFLFPYFFRQLLPAEVSPSISWSAIALGLGMGAVVSVLVCFDALYRLRALKPLEILRAGGPDELPAAGGAVLRRAAVFAILFLLGASQANSAAQAGWFFLFLSAAVLVLSGVARFITVLAGRVTKRSRSFAVRQGFLNLNRANNQTSALTLVIGCAVLFVTAAMFIRTMLLEQIQITAGPHRPNMMFFDIQPDQIAGVKEFITGERIEELDTAPVVTMRMLTINGRAVSEMLKDPGSTIPEWTLQREYRSTYRDRLWESEEIVAGKFEPSYAGSGDVPVSLEEGLAEKLGIGVGAKITFDVQGLEIEAVVASLRKVEWQRLQANFFVVFPAGVLEPAPQSFILGARAETEEKRSELQRASVARFPNVSILDLTTVMKIVDEVLAKFSIVVELIGACLVAVALVILAGAVQASFRARVREQALFKVLGAKRRALLAITSVEYLLLGSLGAVSGALIGVAASWAIGRFALHAAFSWQPAAILLPLAAAPIIAAAIGLAGSASSFRDKPLDVLRGE